MPNSKFTFRPPNFKNLPNDQLATAVDAHLPRLFDAHASLNSTAVKSPALGAGFAMDAGVASVVNGAGTFKTRLSKVEHVVATPDAGAGVPLALWCVAEPSLNALDSIDIVLWTPTAAGDTTPILKTGTFSVHWIATGQADTTT